ncbi:MAG: hypothetical protein R2733_14565 [Acidimicrobiales bacterium]
MTLRLRFARRQSLAALIALTLVIAACGSAPEATFGTGGGSTASTLSTIPSRAASPLSGLEYRIEGVGLGSSCEFTGEFEDKFPCDLWEGESLSFQSVMFASFSVVVASEAVIGAASSKLLTSVESEHVERYQIDGTLVMFVVEGMDVETIGIEFVANDGTSAECVYAPREAEAIQCNDWN